MGREEIQKLPRTDPLAEYRSAPIIRFVTADDLVGHIQMPAARLAAGR